MSYFVCRLLATDDTIALIAIAHPDNREVWMVPAAGQNPVPMSDADREYVEERDLHEPKDLVAVVSRNMLVADGGMETYHDLETALEAADRILFDAQGGREPRPEIPPDVTSALLALDHQVAGLVKRVEDALDEYQSVVQEVQELLTRPINLPDRQARSPEGEHPRGAGSLHRLLDDLDSALAEKPPPAGASSSAERSRSNSPGTPKRAAAAETSVPDKEDGSADSRQVTSVRIALREGLDQWKAPRLALAKQLKEYAARPPDPNAPSDKNWELGLVRQDQWELARLLRADRTGGDMPSKLTKQQRSALAALARTVTAMPGRAGPNSPKGLLLEMILTPDLRTPEFRKLADRYFELTSDETDDIGARNHVRGLIGLQAVRRKHIETGTAIFRLRHGVYEIAISGGRSLLIREGSPTLRVGFDVDLNMDGSEVTQYRITGASPRWWRRGVVKSVERDRAEEGEEYFVVELTGTSPDLLISEPCGDWARTSLLCKKLRTGNTIYFAVDPKPPATSGYDFPDDISVDPPPASPTKWYDVHV